MKSNEESKYKRKKMQIKYTSSYILSEWSDLTSSLIASRYNYLLCRHNADPQKKEKTIGMFGKSNRIGLDSYWIHRVKSLYR